MPHYNRVKRELDYNEIQGYAPGNIPAYSNGADTYWSRESHFLDGIFMGYKWQCVEFARRWLYLRKGLLFESIPTAAEMFDQLLHATRVSDDSMVRFKRFPQGCSYKPSVDSFLIYEQNCENPFGHVSVITEVGDTYIRVAEQNWYFEKWPANYAREIPLIEHKGNWVIDDEDVVLGWLELDEELQR